MCFFRYVKKIYTIILEIDKTIIDIDQTFNVPLFFMTVLQAPIFIQTLLNACFGRINDTDFLKSILTYIIVADAAIISFFSTVVPNMISLEVIKFKL